MRFKNRKALFCVSCLFPDVYGKFKILPHLTFLSLLYFFLMPFTHWPSFVKGFVCVESRAAVGEEGEAGPCPPEASGLGGAMETVQHVQLALERHSAGASGAGTPGLRCAGLPGICLGRVWCGRESGLRLRVFPEGCLLPGFLLSCSGPVRSARKKHSGCHRKGDRVSF